MTRLRAHIGLSATLRCIVALTCFCLLLGCKKQSPDGAASSASPTIEVAPQPSDSAASSPKQPEPGSASSSPSAENRVLLWRAKSRQATVYLLGSIHVAKKSLYPLDPRIEHAFETADTLALELVLDDAEKARAAGKLVSAGTYSDGRKLSQELSPKTQAVLDAYLERSKTPKLAVEGLRPWFLAINVTMGELSRLGYVPELGVDEHLRSQAEGSKKLESLETIEQQVGLFSMLDATTADKMLRQTLEELDTTQEMMQQMEAAWKVGDAKRIDEVALAPMRTEYPDLFEKLFIQRNKLMAARIEKFLKGSGTKLVVVGSGHLVGKSGIVDLLRQRGYRLAQL